MLIPLRIGACLLTFATFADLSALPLDPERQGARVESPGVEREGEGPGGPGPSHGTERCYSSIGPTPAIPPMLPVNGSQAVSSWTASRPTLKAPKAL